ncbi:hypothetical protein HanIR_Chr03g0147541 [Helianthus annuus]|nr:hypothetical protein HanIR_Chr03g0147541 [Helianthus annuus]
MCTLQKRNNLFILTLTGSDQHRLNPTLIATIRSLLSEVKSQSTAEVRRDVLLRGVKVKADEAVVKGLVDSAYDSAEETVGGAVKLGEELVKRKWDGEVYGEIRKALYPEMCNVLGLTAKSVVKARL